MDYRSIIQNSIDYIEENLKAEITAAELSEKAGFSLFHYYRLFQAATGMPVMQYILRRRLIHSIYEISNGCKRIDVALEYGFNTYAGFYKAFRREFGCTPSAFLKNRKIKRPYRLNLFKENQRMITHKTATRILKHWELENESISDINSAGNGNKRDTAYYVVEHFVLKFTNCLRTVKKHIELCQSIQTVGLYAASPVKTKDGREYVQEGELYFFVVRRIPGHPIRTENLYAGDSAAHAKQIGKIIGKLHLALQNVEATVNDADLLTDIKTWAMPKAKPILHLAEPFCKEYLHQFETLYDTLPRQIIHRDLNPGNIIMSDAQWGIIDFELSEKNIRIYDVCYAATAILSESFDRNNSTKLCKWIEIYQNLILGYDSVIKLTDKEREAIPYVVLANQLICVSWFAEQEKYEEIFQMNKSMTLWLIEIFEQLQLQ